MPAKKNTAKMGDTLTWKMQLMESNEAKAFERDWNSFQLKKKAIEDCDCKRGRFCSCFIHHKEGRALFAKHCGLRAFLCIRRTALRNKLISLHSRLFHMLAGSLPGCQCPSEDCHCIRDPTHPFYAGTQGEYESRKAELVKKWKNELQEHGITGNACKEFAIDNVPKGKKKATVPASPPYVPTSPSYSP